MTTEALRVQAAMSAGVMSACSDGALGDVEITYTYDDNGNQTGRTTVQTTTSSTTTTVEMYIFDAENRLAGYRKSTDGQPDHAASASYTYDADGIRTSKTVGGKTTLYTTDRQQTYRPAFSHRVQFRDRRSHGRQRAGLSCHCSVTAAGGCRNLQRGAPYAHDLPAEVRCCRADWPRLHRDPRRRVV